eukprot:12472607-Heterocapsa_arctica.AAC.1
MLVSSPQIGPHFPSQNICWLKTQFHICKGTAKTVYIDGSSYNIGASNYSGWGIWSPDHMSFNEHGPLKGNKQSSDRAE